MSESTNTLQRVNKNCTQHFPSFFLCHDYTQARVHKPVNKGKLFKAGKYLNRASHTSMKT